MKIYSISLKSGTLPSGGFFPVFFSTFYIFISNFHKMWNTDQICESLFNFVQNAASCDPRGFYARCGTFFKQALHIFSSFPQVKVVLSICKFSFKWYSIIEWLSIGHNHLTRDKKCLKIELVLTLEGLIMCARVVIEFSRKFWSPAGCAGTHYLPMIRHFRHKKASAWTNSNFARHMLSRRRAGAGNQLCLSSDKKENKMTLASIVL